MPIFLHIAELIVRKETIAEKYKGGIEQFKKDYPVDQFLNYQEDDQVFSIGGDNLAQLEVEKLMEKGLHYDDKARFSEDFTIILRFGRRKGTPRWKADWLRNNRNFAWDVRAGEKSVARANEIGNMPVNELQYRLSQGEELLTTIRESQFSS